MPLSLEMDWRRAMVLMARAVAVSLASTRLTMLLSESGLIHKVLAGAAVLYQSMSALGFAGESAYSGPIDLSGAPRGASVLVLGAGLAGLVAAYELHRAGYKVTVLEYNHRAGGRAWTLRGGDEYTELGGFRQRCEFDQGLYLNPGPWRIPYHHHAMLDYAKRFKVPLEPFTQVNFNAYVHSQRAFGGKPQRFRHVQSDFHGHVAELLGKAVNRGQLDGEVKTPGAYKITKGLTVLKALLDRVPDADYMYFGDTARLPYGSKSAQTVAHYAVSAAHYLEGHGAQMLVVACNTASALAGKMSSAEATALGQQGIVPGVEYFRGSYLAYMVGYLLFGLIFGMLFGAVGGLLVKRLQPPKP